MHLDNSNVLLYRTMSVVVVDIITVDDAPVASCHLLIRGRRLDGFVRRQPLGGTWRVLPQTVTTMMMTMISSTSHLNTLLTST
jgi:hypothetical protein